MKDLIESDPKQREIRSRNMSKLNETQKERLRVISSETAKKTSARPEILKSRTKKLAEWREREPEAFQKKCITKFANSFTSKPEGELFFVLDKLLPGLFKRNQQLENENFHTKTCWKQVDILCKNEKIIVEFDGPRHFTAIPATERAIKDLKYRVESDDAFNRALMSEWIIIRVAQSMYSYKSGFSFEIIEKILDIIQKRQPGLYRFGKEYGQN